MSPLQTFQTVAGAVVSTDTPATPTETAEATLHTVRKSDSWRRIANGGTDESYSPSKDKTKVTASHFRETEGNFELFDFPREKSP